MAGNFQRRPGRRGAADVNAVVGRAAGFVALLLGYSSAVLALRALGVGVWADAHAPGPLRPDAAVGLAGLVGAWGCLVWWGVGFTVTLLAAVPGRVGGVAAFFATRIAPAAVRRLARYTLGVALVAGTTVTVACPAGAVATGAAPTMRSPGADGPTPGLPSLDRPAAVASREPVPDVNLPVTATRPPTAAHRHGVRVRPAATSDPAHKSAGRSVVVRAGDTLWAIAARHLPAGASNARIAAEWPRWYRANADVVGADPDLIRPGQRLRPASEAGSELHSPSQETR